VFEYMNLATFATFASFQNGTTEWRKKYPSDTAANFGGRFKDSLDNGLNYSLNYFYSYDSNPYIDLSWEDEDGKSYRPVYSSTSSGCGANGTCTTTNGTNKTTVTLKDASNNTIYGNSKTANLIFEEKLNRIHNVGTAFDYTIDSADLPVVLRGEFLYQKDVKTPIISRAALSIGDLTNGLTNVDTDYFKYVIGADVTLLTNMLVSGQFIQFRNLDYIDETHTPVDSDGNVAAVSGSRYTADMATLHLSNGLQKARENKEFYSLFLSKPFGANQLGRWNNIFMFEEGGGKWNRFDVEYSFSDELVGSFELNNYWGDANTQFGQMEDSSNIQVGLKYLF
jgi:hypothetical protein